MLMISLTTFLITSPDNNVAPDINKIISVPELRSRIPTGPEPNDYSYRIQILMMIRVLILIHIFVRVRIHLNLTAGYEYTGLYQTCTKKGYLAIYRSLCKYQRPVCTRVLLSDPEGNTYFLHFIRSDNVRLLLTQ